MEQSEIARSAQEPESLSPQNDIVSTDTTVTSSSEPHTAQTGNQAHDQAPQPSDNPPEQPNTAPPEQVDTEAELILHQRRQELNRHYLSLIEQAEQLKQSISDFDLERELTDERFLRLTAPHSGLSLADAYYALHHQELERQAAAQALKSLSQALSTQSLRPKELSNTKPPQSPHDPKSMTKQERETLKRRIYEARARGEKISVD